MDKILHQIEVAMAREPADLVIRNAKIVNVFTGEILCGDVALAGERIAGIGSYEGKAVLDAAGSYLCPGFVDAHMHIESTFVTPSVLMSAIIPQGTLTVIADPHEIANVCGMGGIRFMAEDSRNIPANVYFTAPSCVPALSFEDSGAVLGPEELEKVSKMPGVIGLGEMMDYPGILAGNKEALAKLELFEGKSLDGHFNAAGPRETAAYFGAGIMTNHECTNPEDAMEQLRSGAWLQLREGTAAQNLESLLQGLLRKNAPTDRMMFCTDDKHLEDIFREGHIVSCIRSAIACGADPVQAIRMATLNPAMCYGLKRSGAVAPGYWADLVLFDNLREIQVNTVIHHGKVVSRNGSRPDCGLGADFSSCRETVHLPPLSPASFVLNVPQRPLPVISIVSGQLLTEILWTSIPSQGGAFVSDETYSKLAVVERHRASGKIGLGFVKGFGIRGGAIASTVAHDSHNLIAVGDNDADLCFAALELQKAGGGMAVVSGGRVLATLPLPIAGLMCTEAPEKVAETVASMKLAAGRLGVPEGMDPFLTLAFLSLPVIPQIRLTTNGLFDVESFNFLSLK